MATNIFILYPIHLFSNIDNLYEKKVYLLEDTRYFTDFKYHKLKLAYHRASMKKYFDKLVSKNIDVTYIDYKNIKQFYEKTIKNMGSKVKDIKIECYCVGDNILENKIKKYISSINILHSLNFTVNKDLIDNNLDVFRTNKNKYNFMNFYRWQRKRLNILMTKSGTPVGGIWSFDKNNRKKLPSDFVFNKNEIKVNTNIYIEEAIKYVETNFGSNYGVLDNFIYPIDSLSSKKWLKKFIKERFKNFGVYEDAETEKSVFLFHSVLTPMMNIGLLTDFEVLDEVLKYQTKIPLNSFEGFIRQIIGWRNYIYAVYLIDGNKIKSMNFMNHKNKFNEKIIWEGQTGIKPIDFIMDKITKYSYAHHIERLMYLGNFLLLCQINPNQVYKLFMEWTIDAYEWVMVPNVYSMSQYADGGMMMNRPYFSSSNYILTMSDYKKDVWCNIWDTLYYNFINSHRKMLKTNYSTARQVAFWDRKSIEEQNKIKAYTKEIFDIYLIK
jgi:deoxyribodipyrimidine photolyase-related protein